MRRNSRIARLTIALSLLLPHGALAGDGHDHGHSHGEVFAAAGGEGGPVTLSAAAISHLDIRTFKLKRTPFRTTTDVFGEVIAAPNHAAELTSPVAGRVASLGVIEGAAVEQGREIAVIEPFQLGAKPVSLTAPISGVVTALDVTKGSGVEPGRSLLRIADLRHLIFRAHLHTPVLMEELTNGAHAEVRFHGLEDEHVSGTLLSIAPVSDEPGHYGEALIQLAGDTRKLAIGIRGTASIVRGGAEPALSIPESAVLGEMGRYFAYVRRGNTFEPRKLELGRRNAHWVEVLDGLRAGDLVVTQGHYQLQFATGGGEAEHAAEDHGSGHAHDHGQHDHEHAEPHSHD